MPLIVQNIKGRSVNRANIVATDADLADLLTLLEGEVTQYKEEGSAGSVSAVYPSLFNTKKISARKDDLSCSFTIRHCKATVGTAELFTSAMGKIHCDWETSVNAETFNKFYDSSTNGSI